MDYIEYLNGKIQGKIEGLSDEQKATILDADAKRASLSNKYRLYNQLFRNVILEFKKLDKSYANLKRNIPALGRFFRDDGRWRVDNDLIAWNLPSAFDNIVNKIEGLKGHIYDWEKTGKARLEKAIEWTENEDTKKKISSFEEKMDSFVEDVLKPLVEVHYPAYEKCRKDIGDQFLRKYAIEQSVYHDVLKEEIDTPEMKEFIRTHVIGKEVPVLDPAQHTEINTNEYIIQNERLDVLKDFISSYNRLGENLDYSKAEDTQLVSQVREEVDKLKEEGAQEPANDLDFGKFVTWY